jgi:outer membrane protein assembly factor BamB
MDASTGRTIWTYKAGGAVKGALAHADGKLYFGDYSGSVTALDLRGRRVWKTGTSGRSFGRVGRVYSTPAVKFGRVYLGSLDGRVYSFVARNGKERWKYRAGGRISGSATVVGKVVYFANLGAKQTSGIDVRNGKRVFKFDRGSFTPVISDGKRIYLTGYTTLYGLAPKGSREADRRD